MSLMAPVGQFFSDLVSDIKSSRRFQVGAVLWLPLIICGFILTIRFGMWHTISDKYKEWKHTVVIENSIQFPDLLVYFDNTNGFYPTPNSYPVCSQDGVQGTSAVTVQPVQCPFPWPIPHGSACYKFPLSQYSSQGMQAFQYHVRCFMQFQADQGKDNMIRVFVPGGFDTMPGGWRVESHPVRPNLAVAMHLEPEVFIPHQGDVIRTWRDHVLYESTIFTGNSPVPFNTTMWIRIPYTAVKVHWASDMGGWMLLALWGGGFFFFWFLHIIVFSIAKLFLPNDSKLFPGSTPSGEYTPLK